MIVPFKLMVTVSAHRVDLLERRPDYDFTGMPEPLNGQLGIGCIQLEELANRVIIEQDTVTETGHDAQNLTVAETFSRLDGTEHAAERLEAEIGVDLGEEHLAAAIITADDGRAVVAELVLLGDLDGLHLPLLLVDKVIIPHARAHAHTYFQIYRKLF